MLLRVENLRVWFQNDQNWVKALSGISFELNQSESIGIVGESGSGKSVTALAILRLLPEKGMRIKGKVWFEDKDIYALSSQELCRLRGKKIAMIFQDPLTALNPVFTVGEQVSECLRYHYNLSKSQAKEQTIKIFQDVGIPAPESRFFAYPHQLSGGMRQRVMIAMALALRPKILIADEPTTALDVTIQAQILKLLQEIKDRQKMSLVFISHDLTVVAQIVERVLVMYAGAIIESGSLKQVCESPLHPYTQGLLNSIPRIEEISQEKRRLPVLCGERQEREIGCPFYGRCPKKMSICLKERPPFKEPISGHKVACWLYD